MQEARVGIRARGRGRDMNIRAQQNRSPDFPRSDGSSPKERSSPIGGSPDRVTKELEAFKNVSLIFNSF